VKIEEGKSTEVPVFGIPAHWWRSDGLSGANERGNEGLHDHFHCMSLRASERSTQCRTFEPSLVLAPDGKSGCRPLVPVTRPGPRQALLPPGARRPTSGTRGSNARLTMRTRVQRTTRLATCVASRLLREAHDRYEPGTIRYGLSSSAKRMRPSHATIGGGVEN
jgi:hypothetical protein